MSDTKRVSINFALIDGWEVWIAEVPTDADEDWITENLSTVMENLLALDDSGNYGMEVVDVEFLDG